MAQSDRRRAQGRAGRSVRRAAPERGPGPGTPRLQKVLAAAGLGSRRECEALIVTGRVEVDRRVVTELGTRVDPRRQRIRVDGVPLGRPKRVYYAVNKPVGVVSTTRDPSGRPRVIDLVPGDTGRLFTVGRLDLHSEGLILVTNDGELANRLTHPRYGVAKRYRVEVAGHPGREVIRRIRRGVYLAEGLTRVAGVWIKGRRRKSTILEVVLTEGRNREIRRVMARIGHKVLRLARIAVGPIRLGGLRPGQYRRLSASEIRALKEATKLTQRHSSRRG